MWGETAGPRPRDLGGAQAQAPKKRFSRSGRAVDCVDEGFNILYTKVSGPDHCNRGGGGSWITRCLFPVLHLRVQFPRGLPDVTLTVTVPAGGN